jgi:hypothetical protein
MQEFRDGSLGPIRPVEELVDFLRNAQELERTKAVHFGTEHELEEVREKKSVEWRLAKLEEEFEKMNPVKSNMILIPTAAQIKRYAKRFN